MKPLLSCAVLNWREFSPEECNLDSYELRDGAPGSKPNIVHLMRVKEKFKGKDLTLHSQLGRIFSCVKRGYSEFSLAEMGILSAEIIISKILGVKAINFHMTENELSPYEITQFQKVIDYAEDMDIEMIYENHVCSAETILRVLENFPELKFCLDIGHLNVAIHKGKFRMDLDEFIERVKPRLVHIHAHNNYGEHDEHNSLDEGNFDWRSLLDKLSDAPLKRIIFENKEISQSLESREIFEKYFSSREN